MSLPIDPTEIMARSATGSMPCGASLAGGAPGVAIGGSPRPRLPLSTVVALGDGEENTKGVDAWSGSTVGVDDDTRAESVLDGRTAVTAVSVEPFSTTATGSVEPAIIGINVVTTSGVPCWSRVRIRISQTEVGRLTTGGVIVMVDT